MLWGAARTFVAARHCCNVAGFSLVAKAALVLEFPSVSLLLGTSAGHSNRHVASEQALETSISAMRTT